jgi:hypothetical protein
VTGGARRAGRRRRAGRSQSRHPRPALLLPSRLLLGVVVPLVGVVVAGVAVLPAHAVGRDDVAAVDLLRRAATVGSRVSFTGTQYVAVRTPPETTVGAVVDVRHVAGGDTTVRISGAGPHELPADPRDSWLAAGSPVDLLADGYEVMLAGSEQVAGRPAEVVEARRPDGTVAARVWLDTATALPMRRETYDADGGVLRASAFVEVRITSVGPTDRRPAADMVPSPRSTAPAPRKSAYDLDHADLTRLRAAGFTCPDKLGDDLVLYEAREVVAGDAAAVQMSYTDGLVTVSVFEQQGRLDVGRLEGFVARRVGDGTVYSRPGPPVQLTWTTGDSVVTVVADDATTTVPAVLAALPPRDPAPAPDADLLTRVRRGAERVGAWLNPFD